MGAAAADLEARQLRILGRIADLELAAQQHRLGALSISAAPSENGEADAGATEAQLSALLAARGVRDFAFRRVPADYYDRSLEERRGLLKADSVAQLCKSIVMFFENQRCNLRSSGASLLISFNGVVEHKMSTVLSWEGHALIYLTQNGASLQFYGPASKSVFLNNTGELHVNTQAAADVVDCSNPKNSKYYVVVVQYNARLNAENIKNFLYELNEKQIPKKRFNMRLAPEEESHKLTGFVHNAVTCIGMETNIPVIIDEAITKLDEDFFWLGGGEVDLKLGMRTSQFLSAFSPFVVKCS